MKILKFNELAGNTYRSIMNKVADKGDPRSFRIFADAKKLRSEFYTKEPLKLLLIGASEPIDFKIVDIHWTGSSLILTTIKDNKQHKLHFDIRDLELIYEDTEKRIKAYVDRKGARVISNILKDYGVEDVRPQDIPHM